MLALACFTHAATVRRQAVEQFLCVAGGGLLGWASNASLIVVVFLPFLPLVLLIKRSWSSPLLYYDIALIAFGGLLGTALVGVGAELIGQPFMIFKWQLREAWAGIGDWWFTDLVAKSVAIPLSLSLSAALICMLARVRDRRSFVIAAVVLLTTTGIFAQTFIVKSTSLLYDAFYILFLVPAVLGVAELLRTLPNPCSPGLPSSAPTLS
jgi:hypothetical protein